MVTGRAVAAGVLLSMAAIGVAALRGVPGAWAADPSNDLQVVAVDAAAYPTVSIDVAVPERLGAIGLTAAAFRVGATGAITPKVDRLDPRRLDVVLVVDNRQTAGAEVLSAELGALVELVRGVDAGTSVGVVTIAGARAVGGASADPRAAIGALASIAPDAQGSLAAALGAAATQLRANTRHLVLAVTAEPSETLGAATITQVAAALRASRTRLDVITLGGAAGSDLRALAQRTNSHVMGADPNGLLGAVDTVTGELTGQYRLTFRADAPGIVPLTLTSGGVRYGATASVPGPIAPRAAPPTTSPSTTNATATTSAPATTATPATTAARPVTTAAASGGRLAAPPTAGSPSGGSWTKNVLMGAAVLLAVGAVVTGVVVVARHVSEKRRRRSRARPRRTVIQIDQSAER
jgi:hypothetical protein